MMILYHLLKWLTTMIQNVITKEEIRMKDFMKNLMMCVKNDVTSVFVLADKIANICFDICNKDDDIVNEANFETRTLTYIFNVGGGEYRIHMDLNSMAVDVTARTAGTNFDIALCRIGINGSFKIEYGRGSSSVKSMAKEIFDEIENIDIDAINVCADKFNDCTSSDNVDNKESE